MGQERIDLSISIIGLSFAATIRDVPLAVNTLSGLLFTILSCAERARRDWGCCNI